MQTVPGPAAPSRKRRTPQQILSLREVRPPGVKKGINPQTGMPLRPGQRLPTYGERDEAIEYNASEGKRLGLLFGWETAADPDEKLAYPRGSFPIGAQYELTPEVACRWLGTEVLARLLERFERYGGDPLSGEWPQFVADLLCYLDLSRRGIEKRPLHRYLAECWELQPGPDGPVQVETGEDRKHWGRAAQWLDEKAPGWRERVRKPGERRGRKHDAEA